LSTTKIFSWILCIVLIHNIYNIYITINFLLEHNQYQFVQIVTIYGFNPPFLWKCLYQVRAIAVFPVFRLLTDFACLLTYEFCLSLWKIARCSVILLLPLFVPIVTSDIVISISLKLVKTTFQKKSLMKFFLTPLF